MQINEMVSEIVWSILVHFLLKNYKLMNYTQIVLSAHVWAYRKSALQIVTNYVTLFVSICGLFYCSFTSKQSYPITLARLSISM